MTKRQIAINVRSQCWNHWFTHSLTIDQCTKCHISRSPKWGNSKYSISLSIQSPISQCWWMDTMDTLSYCLMRNQIRKFAPNFSHKELPSKMRWTLSVISMEKRQNSIAVRSRYWSKYNIHWNDVTVNDQYPSRFSDRYKIDNVKMQKCLIHKLVKDQITIYLDGARYYPYPRHSNCPLVL